MELESVNAAEDRAARIAVAESWAAITSMTGPASGLICHVAVVPRSGQSPDEAPTIEWLLLRYMCGIPGCGQASALGKHSQILYGQPW
jgi:hypothetical protein